MLGMGVPAVIGVYFQLRHIRKNTKSYEDTFYTLTEGGVMMEGDNGQACLYFSWGDIREVRRILNHTVWMQLENGKSFNCLLEGLPAVDVLFHRYSGSGEYAVCVCFEQSDGGGIYAYFDKYCMLVHRARY